jgi:Cu/Ag efflux pump CusA
MLDRLIRLSLANRLTVALLAALMLVFGGLAIRGLPIDVFPDLNRPTVTLLTESHGLSPEEVEVLVSRPLELAMNGAPGVHRVRSQSAPGLSVVWVEFGWDVDIWRARQQVSERLASASAALPERVRPNLGPVSSIMGEILLVGLASHEGAVAGPELRRYADLTLRPRLLSLPGVAEVVTIGGGVEQIEVAVRPETLAARGVPLRVVTDAAALASGATTGGFVERKSQEYLVRNLARTSDPEAIAATPLGVLADGVALTLGDVATVRRAVAPMRGDAGVNAHPGVILSVQKQPGTSTFELDAAVAAALADLSPPGDVEIEVLFRQADFIGAAVANVEEALRDGALLVVLVLVPFLMSWRTTAITLTAIPLSFVTAALVLHGLGMSLDTMTLGGLAVAVGELVDDAIVDVENVWRRLRENHDAGSPRAALDVVADASSEIRGSVVFSTVLVVLVFVPLFSLSGIEGRLFVPLGVAYVTSILASLVVSLTVTPVLCSWLLPGALGRSNAHSGDGWLVRRLKAWDRALLARVLPRPWAVLGVVAWLTLGAALSVPWLGTSFLPAFHEGTATISMIAAPGTSLAESNRMGALAERLLLDVPEVERVGRRTGRAERDEHAEGVHYGELDVDFAEEGRPRDVVLAEIRARLARIPGVVVSVGQPISHRLDHLLSGVRAAIASSCSARTCRAARRGEPPGRPSWRRSRAWWTFRWSARC